MDGFWLSAIVIGGMLVAFVLWNGTRELLDMRDQKRWRQENAKIVSAVPKLPADTPPVLRKLHEVQRRSQFTPPPTPRVAPMPARQEQMFDCQHCGAAQTATRRLVDNNQGISGGKAAAGLLTGGMSLFVAGINRYAKVNEFKCRACGTKWHIA